MWKIRTQNECKHLSYSQVFFFLLGADIGCVYAVDMLIEGQRTKLPQNDGGGIRNPGICNVRVRARLISSVFGFTLVCLPK